MEPPGFAMHQGGCWPLLSGRMALLRWFLGLPALGRLSLLRLQLVVCAGGHGPRLASSVCIRLYVSFGSYPLSCFMLGARPVFGSYSSGV